MKIDGCIGSFYLIKFKVDSGLLRSKIPSCFWLAPCPITLKICLPAGDIGFSHFRPPLILLCRSQQQFSQCVVSVDLFEYFSIIKPLKTMWSRFFRSMLNLEQKSTLENCGEDVKEQGKKRHLTYSILPKWLFPTVVFVELSLKVIYKKVFPAMEILN